MEQKVKSSPKNTGLKSVIEESKANYKNSSMKSNQFLKKLKEQGGGNAY